MNIKQFLVFKACDVLPPELKYYILEFVQDAAAYCIQRLYMFKIAKNVDIFTKIMSLTDENNRYNWYYVNRYMKYSARNITYTYIQEPGVWIDYLEDLIQIYGIYWHSELSNNVNYIINSVRNSNIVYRNTNVEYWNNF